MSKPIVAGSIVVLLVVPLVLYFVMVSPSAEKAGAAAGKDAPPPKTLLNVSYDLSREFYKEFNEAFAAHWKKSTGGTVEVKQSHGGSSKQARAVIDGLEADVVTLNQSTDIAALVKAGKVGENWAAALPHKASAYKSITAFVVRKGNPKGIKDWDDLVKPGVTIALVNPKTGGNGRYTFLSAYGFALEKFGNDAAKAKEFVAGIYKNAPTLDTGGRAATATFAQRNLADVLVTFEAEVAQIRQEFGANDFDLVVPSITLLSDFPVALVDPNVKAHENQDVAKAYLEFLFSETGQELAAKNFYRPSDAKVAARFKSTFIDVKLIDIEAVFGGWAKAQKDHFADGGTFDQIYQAKK